MTHLASLAVLEAVDMHPTWEIAKGVMLTASTAGVGWIIRKLNAIDTRQVNHQHILVGVDGRNGLRSKVSDMADDLEKIKERNWKIDAVTEAEQRQHPGPDRRTGARRLRDVTHEVLDEHARRSTDEYSTEDGS